jgi:hypothetical protein
MTLGGLLAHLSALERAAATELRAAAGRHRDDHDVFHQCHTFALTADKRLERLAPHAERLGGRSTWSSAVSPGSGDLLADVRALNVRLHELALTWTAAVQGAQAARDADLLTVAKECVAEVEAQAKWLTTRLKTGAPQALTVS